MTIPRSDSQILEGRWRVVHVVNADDDIWDRAKQNVDVFLNVSDDQCQIVLEMRSKLFEGVVVQEHEYHVENGALVENFHGAKVHSRFWLQGDDELVVERVKISGSCISTKPSWATAGSF